MIGTGKLAALLFPFVVRCEHTSIDSVANTIENTVFEVINTGLSAVDVAQADLAEYDSKKCTISSSVTCIIASSGENCEDLIVPIEECGTSKMTFNFKFCNNEEDNELSLFKSKTEALVEMEPVGGIDYDNLSPKLCREFTFDRDINTCKRFFSSSLKVEGKRGPKFDGSDYCYAWDFLRIFVKRDPCEITSKVLSCRVNRTGQDCDDFIVPQDECNLEESMTFTYEYCNNEDTPLRFRRQKTIILVEMRDIYGLNLKDLPPGECRTFSATQQINTCKRFHSTSLKVEGWRGDGVSDYCFAYDFKRIYTLRPSDPPSISGPGNENQCEVSSKVKCTVTGTGQDCRDIVVPYEDCKEDFDMTFEFEMCNYEKVQNAFLLGNQKTIALIEMVPVEGLDTTILSPGECRKFRKSSKINTCKRFFSASLKVEGRRGDVFNDYCYAYDFYRSYIKRPSEDSGTEEACDITAEIKCTVDDSGEDCEDIVVPQEQCQEDIDMTFTFSFCNRESTNEVSFIKDTRARIENIDISEFNTNTLKPRECRRHIISQKVNTCKKFFSSEILLEGKRGPLVDGSDYCFAYNFYRSYVTRFEKPTTDISSNPALAPSNDQKCAVTAKITCAVTGTGQPCEEFVVPLDECDENFDMTFEFEWCNYEVTRDLDFFGDRMRALVEMVPVERMNLNTLGPGNCRRRIVKRQINTCKRFFSASLQVEAKKGPSFDGSDYCYAYDFYRVYVGRVVRTNNPTPVNQPSPTIQSNPTNQPTLAKDSSGTCDLSAAITCAVDESGEPCDGFKISREECRDVNMTFVFKYCNLDTTNEIKFKDNLTIALVEMVDVKLDYSNLTPRQCNEVTVTRKIDTCKNFFSASLKVEAKKGPDIDGTDYCYGWNFYRGYISRPGIDTECKMSADITCTHERTGDPCNEIIISEEDCSVTDPMIFDFLYCNEDDEFRAILRPDKTSASVNNIAITNMDNSDLDPNECRSLTITRDIDTCSRSFSAELKVKGRRESIGGLCSASDQYRSIIQRSTRRPNILPTSSPSTRPITPTPAPSECAIDGDERKARILNVISNISLPESFDDPLSPQSLARDWLINVDSYNVFCGKPCSRDKTDGGVFQRYSLAVLYFSLNGDTDWYICGRNSQSECTPKLTNNKQDQIPTTSDNQIWLSPVNECAWGGLACRAETECLDRIEFEANNVNGIIPKEIEQFNSLRYLYLEGAKGLIDYQQSNLKFITGTIPLEVESLSELLILDLNFNKLDGQIPSGIYNMMKLRHLDLNHNMLSGEISTLIGQLKDLRFLQLDFNQFSGQIPADIANAKNLINADFQRNNFTGTMPGGLCTLRNPGFRLKRLASDCAGANPEVQCFCCSTCFEDGVDNFDLSDPFS